MFGRNSASYKFALGKSLLDLAGQGQTSVSLEQLADPFATHVCDHLQQVDRQGTNPKSRFLNACRAFNRGQLSRSDLLTTTVRLGFVNVINAFHVVGPGDVGVRFFVDDRGSRGGILLTDELLSLASSAEGASLNLETEARWRLVETAWDLGVAAPLLDVTVDHELRNLVIEGTDCGRVDVTSCRDALNGYQKGRCLYCVRPISPDIRSPILADVDHLFPFRLQRYIGDSVNLNGVWNLVLSCKECNRGIAGKHDRLAGLQYLEQLAIRNDYLIDSHHPLRETLRRQTGRLKAERHTFLQELDRAAVALLGAREQDRWVVDAVYQSVL